MNLYDADRDRWIEPDYRQIWMPDAPSPLIKGPADTGAHADQPTRDKYASRGFSEFSEAKTRAEALLFVAVSLLFAVPLILAGIMLSLN